MTSFFATVVWVTPLFTEIDRDNNAEYSNAEHTEDTLSESMCCRTH